MRFFNRQGCWAVVLGAVMAVGAVCWVGCGYSVGTFEDERDGQKYRTVKIRNQVWMAENLRFDTLDGCWCYENSEDSCQKYGRLYDWETAKVVCPNGWHMPTRGEWIKLAAVAKADTCSKKLKTRSGWNVDKNGNGNGTDKFRFSALPGGTRTIYGTFNGVGKSGNWWTTTESSSGYANIQSMYYGNNIVDEYYYDKGYGYSLRCLED